MNDNQDEPIEEHGTMDKIELTHRFVIERGHDHVNGVYALIVENYHKGDTAQLEAFTTAYNAQYQTTFNNDDMAEALQGYVDENERHLMGFLRAVYEEEIDPIGFHERAFFDSLTKINDEDTANE